MPSARLLAIDVSASAAIDRGEVANERAAAIKFLSEYGNEGSDPDQKNNRIRDIANRIKKYRAGKITE